MELGELYELGVHIFKVVSSCTRLLRAPVTSVGVLNAFQARFCASHLVVVVGELWYWMAVPCGSYNANYLPASPASPALHADKPKGERKVMIAQVIPPETPSVPFA